MRITQTYAPKEACEGAIASGMDLAPTYVPLFELAESAHLRTFCSKET